MSNEIIDSVDLNLPPGVITKMAQKAGVIDKVNEVELLDAINRRLAPKFREMICLQSYENRKDLAAENGGAAQDMEDEEEGSDEEQSIQEQEVLWGTIQVQLAKARFTNIFAANVLRLRNKQGFI